jgi:hypothetical protein
MHFTYDTLTEDPIALVVSELLFLNEENPDFVARFVRSTIMSWDRFWDYSPFPRHAGAPWLWEKLFLEVFYLQEKRQFTPKTLTGLFVGIVVGLFRLGTAILSFCLNILSTIWRMIGPTVTKGMYVLPLLAWNLFLTLFNLADTQLRESGYTWGSPLVWLCKILPVRLWQSLIATCIYMRLVLWIYVQNSCPCKGKISLRAIPTWLLATSSERR